MTRTLLIALVLGLAAAPVHALLAGDSASDPSTDCGWPQWRGPHRDGVSPEPIVTWPPVRLWSANVGSGVSSVIAVNGRAYAMGHRDGQDTVFCLDGQTGKTIWRYSYPSRSDQTSDVRFPARAPRRRLTARPCTRSAWKGDTLSRPRLGHRPLVQGAGRDRGQRQAAVRRLLRRCCTEVC